LLKAANLLLLAKKPEEARKLLANLAETSEVPEVAAAARFGLLELDYQSGDYSQIAGLTDAQIEALPSELWGRAYLLAANAHREREEYPEALRIYDRIVRDYAGSPAEAEAQFNRLVCLFRMDDPTLLPSLNRFLLEARDPKEIAQARMLKAETHFQAGDFADAAATYGALMSSSLPPALLADAAYKHAWCLAKIGQHNQATIAYSEFLTRFPEDPQVPAALLGRALAHQSAGAPDAALRDFDQVLSAHPQSPEREVALLQRGLLYGAQRNYAKMREDFEKLLTDFPETKARAQAEFWIGYAFFEEKDYEKSLAHFDQARQLDPEAYGPRANLRLLLANYYLERPSETAKVIEENELPNVPAEVYQWLAAKFLEIGDQPAAEKYLRIILSGKAGNAPTPELYLQLGQNQLLQNKYEEALAPISQYLELVKDPPSRARAMLARAEAEIGLKRYEDAEKSIGDALLLQPEGRINAESRLLSARLQEAKGQPAEAARIYMTVAVLYDDETITPKALRAAQAAYRKSGDAAGERKAAEELKLRYPSASTES
jgi:tetratricopeptide (TPR) repeat protein